MIKYELPPISRVLIVGSGWVGRQIGAKLVESGIDIGLTDRNESVVEEAAQWIEQSEHSAELLPGVPKTSHSPTLTESLPAANRESSSHQAQANSPKPTRGIIHAFASFSKISGDEIRRWDANLVIECVPEQLSLKKRVLRTISELASPQCIIASNTSYFVPSVLSQFVINPERYAQMHFHVPVLRDSVVDIVGCEQTQPAVLQRLAELSQRIGQYPLMLRKEHPGYVFNWLLQSVLKAALELVALDVVDFEDVDRSWKSVTGMPLGPFGIMDQIGLDVIDQVLSNARWAEPLEISDQKLLEILRPLTQQGRLGTKTGAGFYTYAPPGEHQA